MMPRLSLWDRLACDGGKPLADIDQADVVSGYVEFAVDNSDSAELVVWDGVWWIGFVKRGSVMRVELAPGEVSEWFVRRITDGIGEGQQPVKRIQFAPVSDVLRTAGPVFFRTTGGLTRYSLGAVSNTVHQILDTWLVQTMAAHGYGYVKRGVVTSLRLIGLAWDRWTSRELAQGVAELVSEEWRLRWNDDEDYRLDVLPEIGADLPEVELSPGRNLISLLRTQGDGPFANAIIPKGMPRGGDAERHGIEEATWVVRDVTGDVLTLGARNGGDGPIQSADQYTGLYLEARDGSRVEIVACTTDQEVEVTDATDFAVDDDVVFVQDAAGTRLVEIPNQPVIEDAGRECVTHNFDQFRGERNHVRNPFFSDHDGVEGSIPGGYLQSSAPYDFGSAQSGTTITVGHFPPGWVFAAGETVRFATHPTASPRYLWETEYEIVTGDTADANGEATIEIDAPVTLPGGGPLDMFGTRHYYSNAISATYPRHWISDGLLARLRPTSAQSITGALIGTHTDATTIFVDGLPPGEIIYPWTLVQFASNPSAKRTLVSEIATVDEDGAVTLFCTFTNELTGASGAMDGADNEGVTLSRPEITGRVGNWCLVVGDGSPGAGQDPINQQVIIPHYTGMPTVVFSAQITLWNTSNQTRALGTNLTKASIGVYDATGTTPIITLTDPSTGNIESGGVRTVTLAVEVDVTATTEYQFRITAAGTTGGLQNRTLRTIVHWSTAYAQADPEESIPPVVGSFGTELAQGGGAKLRELSLLPISYTTTMANLAAVDGYDGNERIGLGTVFRARVSQLGIAARLRCLRYRADLKDPAKVAVTLGTIPPKSSTVGRKARAQFLGLVTDGARRSDPTTLQPSPETEGAYRSIGRWQQPLAVPDDAEVLTIAPYEAA